MENILIGTTIPALTGLTLNDLTEGQIGLLLYNTDERTAPLVRGNEVTNTELLSARAIQFVKKSGTGFEASIPIPNKSVNDRNYQAYVAGVAGIHKLGDNASAATALTFPNPGEGTIRITDLTNTYKADNFPANISATKSASETTSQYLTRVKDLINNDPVAKLLVTATVQVAGSDYQLRLTTTSYKIKLGVATDGIFAPYHLITETPRVYALGAGEQIQEIEKQLTVFKGNGNYSTDGDLYYKEPLKSSLSTNYNTLSITWTGIAQPSVSTTMAVASVNLLVCVPAADVTLLDIYNTFITPAPIIP